MKALAFDSFIFHFASPTGGNISHQSASQMSSENNSLQIDADNEELMEKERIRMTSQANEKVVFSLYFETSKSCQLIPYTYLLNLRDAIYLIFK